MTIDKSIRGVLLVIGCLLITFALYSVVPAQDNAPAEPKNLPANKDDTQSELGPIVGDNYTPLLSAHFKLESCLPKQDNDNSLANSEKCYELFKQVLSITDDEVIWNTRCRLWITKNKIDYKKVADFLTQGNRSAETLQWKKLVAFCPRFTFFYSRFPLEVCCANMDDKIDTKPNPLPLSHCIAHLLLYYWNRCNYPLWVSEGFALYLSIAVEKDSAGCVGEATLLQEKDAQLWNDPDNWSGLLAQLVEDKKDTPLRFLAKRNDPNNFRNHEKAKIWSVLNFLIEAKRSDDPNEKPLPKEKNLFRKFILSFRTMKTEDELAINYNGLDLDQLDAEWRNWLLGLKKAGKIKPVK